MLLAVCVFVVVVVWLALLGWIKCPRVDDVGVTGAREEMHPIICINCQILISGWDKICVDQQQQRTGGKLGLQE